MDMVKHNHDLSLAAKYNDAYRHQWKQIAMGRGKRRVFLQWPSTPWVLRRWNHVWASNPGLFHRAAVYRAFGPLVIEWTAPELSDGLGDEHVLFPNMKRD